MTFISDTFGFLGKAVGETVHQTGELVVGTGSVAMDVLTDISNIPSAIADGYKEELFQAEASDRPIEVEIVNETTAEPKAEA